MNKEKREYNVDFLPMLDWTHWWFGCCLLFSLVVVPLAHSPISFSVLWRKKCHWIQGSYLFILKEKHFYFCASYIDNVTSWSLIYWKGSTLQQGQDGPQVSTRVLGSNTIPYGHMTLISSWQVLEALLLSQHSWQILFIL